MGNGHQTRSLTQETPALEIRARALHGLGKRMNMARALARPLPELRLKTHPWGRAVTGTRSGSA